MYRIISFLFLVSATITIGFFSYFVFALFYSFISRRPYELVFLGFILDRTYYFGSDLLLSNILFIYSIIIVFISIYTEDKVVFNKRI